MQLAQAALPLHKKKKTQKKREDIVPEPSLRQTDWRAHTAAMSTLPPPPPPPSPDMPGGDDGIVYMEPEKTWSEVIVDNREAIEVVTGAARDMGVAVYTLTRGLTGGLVHGAVSGVRAGLQGQEPVPLHVIRRNPEILALPAPEVLPEAHATVDEPPVDGGSSVLPYVAGAAAAGTALYGAYRFGAKEKKKSKKEPKTPSSTAARRDDDTPGSGQPPQEG